MNKRDRTQTFSKGFPKNGNYISSVDPIHVFNEGVNVKVYDECAQGRCTCRYDLGGETTELKPCRFAYLVSLGTADCKKAYDPLLSNITDGS